MAIKYIRQFHCRFISFSCKWCIVLVLCIYSLDATNVSNTSQDLILPALYDNVDLIDHQSNLSIFSDANENSLGRELRVWLEHDKWYFPELFEWIDGHWYRRFNFPATTIEYLGGIAIFVIIVFANMGGLSGGLFTFIVLYELYGFQFRKTLGYAAGINFIASVMRFILFYYVRNPTKRNKTLIDYDLVLILLPMGLFGLFWGRIIFGFLPMIAASIISIIIWAGAAIYVFKKGIFFLKKENRSLTVEDYERSK